LATGGFCDHGVDTGGTAVTNSDEGGLNKSTRSILQVADEISSAWDVDNPSEASASQVIELLDNCSAGGCTLGQLEDEWPNTTLPGEASRLTRGHIRRGVDHERLGNDELSSGEKGDESSIGLHFIEGMW